MNSLCDNLRVSPEGRLLFHDRDLADLAQRYGTPLYLYDEDRIRATCRLYRRAMQEAFGEDALPLYASKAASFTHMYRIMTEEGLGCDVVSRGEIATAKNAGFDLSRAFYHSNNKTDEDLSYAMECGVGCFVADNEEELYALSRLSGEKGITSRLMLRITPGIDPHTYEEVATGKVDSKFGSAIETGQAMEICRLALSLPHLELMGFHCHVGSQVFDADVFMRSAVVMLEFIADVKKELGYEAKQLDLGGGWGVRYVHSDPVYDLRACILEVGRTVSETVARLGLARPRILMEPGRSIVADAGLTLYTVGTVKRIPGYKNYVSVNGGMADNPRYALYRSAYTVCLPEKMGQEEKEIFSVVGCCCESGDILQENVSLPANVCRGDLLAVLTTGAYNYSMASHYNRIPKPPVVMISDEGERLAVRRETAEDMFRYDV